MIPIACKITNFSLYLLYIEINVTKQVCNKMQVATYSTNHKESGNPHHLFLQNAAIGIILFLLAIEKYAADCDHLLLPKPKVNFLL